MFINKTPAGRNNLSGQRIAVLRKERGLSRRALAEQMQLLGIEAGLRFVTNIELRGFARCFSVSADFLLTPQETL